MISIAISALCDLSVLSARALLGAGLSGDVIPGLSVVSRRIEQRAEIRLHNPMISGAEIQALLCWIARESRALSPDLSPAIRCGWIESPGYTGCSLRMPRRLLDQLLGEPEQPARARPG